jgi:hypothetical protein
MTELKIFCDSLNINEQPTVDESIESFEYREYEPQNPQAVNSYQAIQIDVHNQDIFTQPSKSYLYIEGQLSSTVAAKAYTADTKVSLINNAIPFLFSQIRFLINNVEIESLLNPGQATTIKGLLVYGNDLSAGEGMNMCWYKDTTDTAADENKGFKVRRNLIISKPDPKGTFSFAIPLCHLFGFCEDYTKVIYGVKQSLILSRQTDSDAIFHETPTDGAPADGKITITKLSWLIPHILPSIDAKLMLEKVINNKTKIPIAFRAHQCDTIAVPRSTNFSWRLTVKAGMEKPRWLIVAFQTNKSNNQLQNPAIFNHLNLTGIYAFLNSDRYPMIDMNIDFPKCQFSKAYRMMSEFKKNYYGVSEKESSNQITPLEFVDLYPLFVIDLRRQSEKLKNSVQDVQIKATFNENPPANTIAYALLLSDRLFHLQSDGQRFQTVY